MTYQANLERYKEMKYVNCGKSGLKLPLLSLGLWNNFGGIDSYENGKEMITKSFNTGITHFDLADGYGPPKGSTEEMFGRILKKELSAYRDEIIISTKTGHKTWVGPYGGGASRKHIIAAIDQSLKRLGVDYIDIYYSHIPDHETPIEETVLALEQILRDGKALYIGISNYSLEETKSAFCAFKDVGIKCLIHQPYYNMFDRSFEKDLQQFLMDKGIGSIAFCPLAQGLLTNKYLSGIPEGSRLAKKAGFIRLDDVSETNINKVKLLHEVAESRNQSLPQMALAWVLRKGKVTTALIGASKFSQIEENVGAISKLEFTDNELNRIDQILFIC